MHAVMSDIRGMSGGMSLVSMKLPIGLIVCIIQWFKSGLHGSYVKLPCSPCSLSSTVVMETSCVFCLDVTNVFATA